MAALSTSAAGSQVPTACQPTNRSAPVSLTRYPPILQTTPLAQALDTILKEKVFRDARAKLGGELDLFVVNSAGSLAQGVFVFLLLPCMTALRGMSLADLPNYLVQGGCGGGCGCGVPCGWVVARGTQ